MIITGRIYDIRVVSDLFAQIVLRKKMNDKVVPVAIGVFGYWKDKIINEMKLKPKDKIRGKLYMKSKLWTDKNGVEKYSTDVYFKEVFLVEEGARTMGSLFEKPQEEEEDIKFDEETGEVFE